MTLIRTITNFVKHPSWAFMEGLARIRTRFAPQSGVVLGKVGAVTFRFDFHISPYVREMYVGAYEIEVVGLMHRLLTPGATFVDVGANIGYLSAVGASIVGISGKVISFEPAPDCFARLEELRNLNSDLDWQVRNIGLGAEKTSATLSISSSNIGWNSLVPGQIPPESTKEVATVPVERLDDCLANAGEIALMKIDVEGYESCVLQGAGQLLASGHVKNLIVEVQPGQYASLGKDFNKVMTQITSYGYKAHSTRAPHRPIDWSSVRDGDDIWFRL